jgi:hypothetical protein
MSVEILQYITDLNAILRNSGYGFKVSAGDFQFLGKVVVESSRYVFSRQITKPVWPPVSQGEFYHYTRKDAAESILQSQVLRLYSLRKRIAEGEISTFLERFHFAYPLEVDPITGEPRFATTIADRRFYLSLTDVDLTEEEERYFWEHFAGRDGARLRFRFTAKLGCLRAMAYGNKLEILAETLNKIDALTARSLNRKFHWDDSGIVCALHLPKDYDHEKETRLIASSTCGLPIVADATGSYLEMKFGYNPLHALNIELVEVQSDCDLPKVPGVPVTKRA